MNSAIRNWLRRARLINQKKVKPTMTNAGSSDMLDATETTATVSDSENVVFSVECSDLEISAENDRVLDKISGTIVSFVLLDD